MAAIKKIIDGSTAAAYVAYAFSDVATIYPISPIAEMGDIADRWRIAGVKNIFGTTMEVKELESELGAAGATHGALAAGALATTFTASQGLLLMIPNMFKIAGELLPGVFHVGCRSVAAHALSIFGDHQDIMACRTTGFAFLGSNSVQEAHDMAIVAHLAAIEGSLPVVHFFDGWRTSNETSTIEMASYDDLKKLVVMDKVKAFRARGLNPEHPVLRGSAQNPDVYFQNREAANRYYDAFPAIVQSCMNRVNALTGRKYGLMDYVGDPEAELVIVSMGSSCEVIEETIKYLAATGYQHKTGLVKVRLFRPFSDEALLKAIPGTAKAVAVLDRTKEPGAEGEPMYLDVSSALRRAGRQIKVIGGRYGLSSKEFDPSMVKRIYDELASPRPLDGFTIGIDDDVTHRSLKIADRIIPDDGCVLKSIFYGMGSDGTVGATKQVAKIIGQTEGFYSQAFFNYSAKKSGGYTISQLRIARQPVKAEYSIESADYISCNKNMYVKRFDLVGNLRCGGIFVLNSSWTAEDMDSVLPASLRRAIAARKARFYNIDAIAIARKNGLGVKINMIMETVFFKLTGIIPFDEAMKALCDEITATYMHEGAEMVNRNIAALDLVVDAITEINYPSTWLNATDDTTGQSAETSLPPFIRNVARPCLRLEGNMLPVSAFSPDGSVPPGTTAYEKRTIAINIPRWDATKCVECTECSLVCAHAAIRPYLLTPEEAQNAPEGFVTRPASGKLNGYRYRIQVFPHDCTGCGSCAVICPGHALTMVPIEEDLHTQEPLLQYALDNVALKEGVVPRATINGSQFYQPLLQFSGACAGCGETPYVKLLTQLMGERMIIANATGCSSIWGANFPSNADCTNTRGQGPAWGNSLFEDNAEYGYGMEVAVTQRRNRLAELIRAAVADQSTDAAIKAAMQKWLGAFNDPTASAEAGNAIMQLLPNDNSAAEIREFSDMFAKKSIWAIGGDGWAYDIGFAGLDHVLAQDRDINLLVMDTECYSNTGGQTSKATPLGAVARYSADGKRTFKKDLGRMMMTYGNVYVASIALGANYMQAIKAFVEADAYPGPSIVIAYCPCINHGIRAGMGNSIVEERKAVKSGYWPLYRYDPRRKAQGLQPLQLDSSAPDGSLLDFINGEDRYVDLKMLDAEEAAVLQPELKEHCDLLYDILLKQSQGNQIS